MYYLLWYSQNIQTSKNSFNHVKYQFLKDFLGAASSKIFLLLAKWRLHFIFRYLFLRKHFLTVTGNTFILTLLYFLLWKRIVLSNKNFTSFLKQVGNMKSWPVLISINETLFNYSFIIISSKMFLQGSCVLNVIWYSLYLQTQNCY